MKRIIILVAAFFIADMALLAQTKAGKVDTTKHATFYTCPHHSEIKSDDPGKCPKCGMALNLSGKEKMSRNLAKVYTCPVHIEVTKHDPGKCPQCGKKLNLSPKEEMKVQVMKLYTCPMHPEVALDKEGKCPKCGTALAEKEKD